MNILVTGNMGYVGPPVVTQLRASWPEARLCGLDAGYFAHCLTGAGAMPERCLNCQFFADVRHPPGEALAASTLSSTSRPCRTTPSATPSRR